MWKGAQKNPYKYALCAASTCTPTGQMIATNGGNFSYPEVVCTCPVIEGMAIAAPQNGNMQGSCIPPIVDGKAGVWSLFAPLIHYPQEANGLVWRGAIRVGRIQPAEGEGGGTRLIDYTRGVQPTVA